MNDIIFQTEEELIDSDDSIYEKIFMINVTRINSLVKIEHDIKNIESIINLHAFTKDNSGNVYATETKIGYKAKTYDTIYIIMQYTKQ